MRRVDGTGADDAETAASVVGEVVFRATVERAAHAGVDAAVGVEETFFVGEVEEGAVVCAGVGGDAASQNLRIPGRTLVILGRFCALCERLAYQESMWLSKWMTDIGPKWRCVERNADRVVVWSPPSVRMRGTGAM